MFLKVPSQVALQNAPLTGIVGLGAWGRSHVPRSSPALSVRPPALMGRRANALARFSGRGGLGGLGMGAVLVQYTTTGPQLVDENARVLATPTQVAADPSLLNSVASGAAVGCPAGEVATSTGPFSAPICAAAYGPGDPCAGVFNRICQPNLYGSIETPGTPASELPAGWVFTSSGAVWTGAGPAPGPAPATPASMLVNPTIQSTANYSGAGSAGGAGSSAAAAPVAVAIENTSRPGYQFQVGDNWRLTIAGAANQPVQNSATLNGLSLGSSSYGSTGPDGRRVLTGSFDASTVGAWRELWTVGSQAAPALTFNVASAAAAAGGSASSPQGTNVAGSIASASALLSQGLNVFGYSIPLWAAAAGGLGLLWFLGGRRNG